MSKRIIQIISILFLFSLLIVSCNNKDKIGPTDTNTSDISQYAGNWRLSVIDRLLTINKDGTVIFDNIKMSSIKSDSANVYTIEFRNTQSGDIFIRFDFNSKTYELGPIGGEAADKGTITNETTESTDISQYAGNWRLSVIDRLLTINKDGTVIFDNFNMSSIKSDGANVYTLEFKNTQSGDIFIKLDFNSKTYELGPIGGEAADKGTITKETSLV